MPQTIYPDGNSINPLRSSGFQFSVQKLPKVQYFVQQVSIPQLSLGVQTQATQVHDIKIPGETLDFDTLNVTFQVDENLQNWNSIYFWMFGLGYPEDHKIYRDYLETSLNQFQIQEAAKGYSDAQLIILNSSNNPIQTFNFTDIFPISLSGLEFDSTDTMSSPMKATVQFAYSYYTISRAV